MLQRIVLGDIALRARLAKPLNPESPPAQQIGVSLARSLNRRLLQARIDGTLPPYPIAAELLDIRSGSLIARLQLHADVSCERGRVVAFTAFAKTYPELATDIKIVAANVFGAVAGMVEVQVANNGLLNPWELEASLCLLEESKAAS
jgi:hypothetical protein